MITPTRIAALATAFFVIVTAPVFLGVLTAEDGPIAKIDGVVNGTPTTITTTTLGDVPSTPTHIRITMSPTFFIRLTDIGGNWLDNTQGPLTRTFNYPPSYRTDRTFVNLYWTNCSPCPVGPTHVNQGWVLVIQDGVSFIPVAAGQGSYNPATPPWMSPAWISNPTSPQTEIIGSHYISAQYTPIYERPTITTSKTTYTGGMRGYWFHPLMAVLVDLMPIGIYLNVGFAIIALWKLGSPGRSSKSDDSSIGFGSGTF